MKRLILFAIVLAGCTEPAPVGVSIEDNLSRPLVSACHAFDGGSGESSIGIGSLSVTLTGDVDQAVVEATNSNVLVAHRVFTSDEAKRDERIPVIANDRAYSVVISVGACPVD